MSRGAFITFEGPEGAGKTTQLDRLAATLRERGVQVTCTREPGGTPGGEALRSVLLDPDTEWSGLAEALLMNAARDAHLRQVVLPALDRGDVVLCDRFALSTRAYQGGGGGIDETFLKTLEAAVVTRRPDLVVVFDLPPDVGLHRAAERGAADRFERKGADYHARVAEAFRRLAAEMPNAALLDACGPVETVSARLAPIVEACLAERGILA